MPPLEPGRHNHLTITHAGRNWSGDWKQEGREVCLSSAYGSKRCAYGRRKPELVAADLLREAVEEWRRGRA